MRLLAITSCLLLGLICTPLMAQLESENAKAAIVFDVRMEKIVNSPLGKSLRLKEQIENAPVQSGPELGKIVRVFGAATAPKNMAEVQQIQNGDLPIDFFVQVEFETEEAAQKMLQQAIDKNDGTVERNGVTYYKAPADQGMPAGVMMYSANSKAVEIGTDGFAFRSGGKPFTENANNAWGKAPDEAIRLAVDLVAAQSLLDEMGQQAGGNPQQAAVMGMITKIKDATLSIDLSGKNLLTFQATGKSASDAAEMKSAADGMLAKAKEDGRTQAEQLKQMNPAGGDVMLALVEGINSTADGEAMTINVPKPEGFDDTVSQLVGQMMAMFGPGAGMNLNN